VAGERPDNHWQFRRDASTGIGVPRGGDAPTAQPTTVLVGNDQRKALTITNDSDTVMYAALGADTAAVNIGLRLNANGGVLHIECDSLGYVWVGPVSLICASASKNYTMTEEQ
jgi:hypothetical protein